MSKSSILTIIAVVLGLSAAKISLNLMQKHITGSSGEGWFEAGCADEESGGPSCGAVLASRYGYFPPKHDDEPEGTRHVPAAFLGVAYYTALVIWLIGVGRPSHARRWVHVFPLGVLFFGLLSSGFYTYIMLVDLDTWCPWCLVTHILNLCIAVCVVLMWPRERKPARAVEPGRDGASGRPGEGAGTARTAAVVHPSGRLVVMVIIAIGLALFGEAQVLGRANTLQEARSAKQGFDQCMAAVNRIKGDAKKLVNNWKLATKREFTIRPDDPIRTEAPAGEPSWDVVVFSDFECPPCAKFAGFLEDRVQPLFDHRLRVVYRYYPLNRECNKRVSRTMYRHGCMAAAMAEAARVLGGDDVFWQAHDYLFQHQTSLKKEKLGPDELAAVLGLDPQAFRQTMNSDQTARRIAEHVEQGCECEVRGTPCVFVNGQQVDVLAMSETGFWDRMADMYWRSLRRRRPESTKLAEEVPTPNSRDQKGGP